MKENLTFFLNLKRETRCLKLQTGQLPHSDLEKGKNNH